jgi:protein-S-isoprenylcysteine O-methyltransferase Ste14
LLTRAVLAFLSLPAIVAGLIPWALSQLTSPIAWRSIYGVLPVIVGMAALVASAVSFYRRGKGTLAPWDPPSKLVVQDLYRFNRNPMYVGLLTTVVGWSVLSGSLWIYIYAAVLPLVFHLRVVLHEEREMRRLLAEDWEHYRRSVPRWGIRFTPYTPEHEPG